MTNLVLFCTVDPAKDALRLERRGDHLAYLQEHLASVAFGGPLLRDDGTPDVMMIVLATVDRAEAASFIAAEPYHASGVFSKVEVRGWNRVLPESHAGALAEAVAAERARSR